MEVLIVNEWKNRAKNEVLIREVMVSRMFNDRGEWTTRSDAIGECEADAVDVMCRPKVAADLVFAFYTEYDYDGDGYDETLEFFTRNANRGSVVVTLFAKAEAIRSYLAKKFGATVS